MLSFRQSIAMGSEMLELDVRLSRDGVPVVIHDATVDRVSEFKGPVAHFTAAQLTALDLGAGLRFPTLREALTELTERVPVNVELKFDDANYRPLTMAVCEVIESLGVLPRILISSFFHPSLAAAQRRLPAISVAPLFGELTGPPHEEDLEPVFARPLETRWPELYPFQGRAAVVWWKMIDPELVQRFADNDATLLTYTVDEPEEMRRLVGLGIDGIITNRPSVAVRVVEEIFGAG